MQNLALSHTADNIFLFPIRFMLLRKLSECLLLWFTYCDECGQFCDIAVLQAANTKQINDHLNHPFIK